MMAADQVDDPRATPQRPLEFWSTADLIDELQRRHVETVIVRSKELKPGVRTTYCDYSGGLSAAVGLAARFIGTHGKL